MVATDNTATASMHGPAASAGAFCRPAFSLDDLYRLSGLSAGAPKTAGGDADVQFRCQRVLAGRALYRMGHDFENVYIVRLGQLKTVLHGVNGDEHILSFPMKGDFLGFDGIYMGRYASDAIALTDAEVLVLPYRQVLALGCRHQEFERIIYAAASREMNRERLLESLHTCLKAEARVAWFIEMQAQRYASLGYSSKNFVLPMTRRDVGNYLRISLETVSRSLSVLAQTGIISVQRREIRILAPDRLHQFRPVRGEAQATASGWMHGMAAEQNYGADLRIDTTSANVAQA
jgi:CRP/FNR family transcriptional regulator